MAKKITAILAAIVATMFSFPTLSEVKNMDTNQALSATQQSIIPIAFERRAGCRFDRE